MADLGGIEAHHHDSVRLHETRVFHQAIHGVAARLLEELRVLGDLAPDERAQPGHDVAAEAAAAPAPEPRPAGAGTLPARAGLPLFQWTVTDGLKRLDTDLGPPLRTLAQPPDILKHIRATALAGVYALLDFHPYLQDPTLVRLLKDIAQDYERCPRTVVLIGYQTEIPHELEHLAARVALALPDRNERRQLVEEVARQWMRANPRQAVKIDARALELLVENMSGLSAADTQRLARKAIYDHGTIELSDVPLVMKAKYELLNHAGVLRYEHDTAQLSDVGGLVNFKAWLRKRSAAFDGSAPELDPPKGVLLLGVQGCGKSLAARASAGIFHVPLLRLDCAALYDKDIGESERNLRESLASADVLAPCVLWIDEIEKGFAAGDSDGGATRRGVALDAASLGTLARECEGFSGAEIEQAIVAALYSAHAKHTAPDAQLLSAEIAATRPLAVVMAESVAALRDWAKERTVPAD